MPKQYNQGSNSRHQSMPLLQKNSESKKKCKTLPVQVELNQIQTAPKHSSRVKIQNLKLCSKAKHLTRTTARREETTSLR
jgi:hypothetical protein